jgi:hypothetical protein
MLQQHVKQGTDVTVGCLEWRPRNQARSGSPMAGASRCVSAALQRSRLFTGVDDDVTQPMIDRLNA